MLLLLKMFVLYNPKKNHSTFSLPGLARRIISFFNRVEACLTRNEQRAAQDDEVHPYALLSLCRISIKVSKMIDLMSEKITSRFPEQRSTHFDIMLVKDKNALPYVCNMDIVFL